MLAQFEPRYRRISIPNETCWAVMALCKLYLSVSMFEGHYYRCLLSPLLQHG